MKKIAIIAIIFALCAIRPVFADDTASVTPTPPLSQEQLDNTLLSGITMVCDGQAYISFYSSLVVQDAVKLWRDLRILKHRGVNDVHLFVCSNGGGAYAAFGIIDTIRKFKAQDMNIIGHASGLVASAAVPIFAVCSKRLAGPSTIFMVHEASMFPQGPQRASDITATHDMLDIMRPIYRQVLVDNSNLSMDEWVEKDSKTTWFNVNDAMEWGLVDAIDDGKEVQP